MWGSRRFHDVVSTVDMRRKSAVWCVMEMYVEVVPHRLKRMCRDELIARVEFVLKKKMNDICDHCYDNIDNEYAYIIRSINVTSLNETPIVMEVELYMTLPLYNVLNREGVNE